MFNTFLGGNQKLNLLPDVKKRELKSGKNSQIQSSIINPRFSSSENVKREVSEFQTLTQEAVGKQIRVFFASLTRQLDEFIRVVQGRTTSRHPNSRPSTELGTTSSTAMSQSDTKQCFRYYFCSNNIFLKWE